MNRVNALEMALFIKNAIFKLVPDEIEMQRRMRGQQRARMFSMCYCPKRKKNRKRRSGLRRKAKR